MLNQLNLIIVFEMNNLDVKEATVHIIFLM